MEVIDPDFQGHLASYTKKTAFNVALVDWSRPAKECYTSQMCSCFAMNYGELLMEYQNCLGLVQSKDTILPP